MEQVLVPYKDNLVFAMDFVKSGLDNELKKTGELSNDSSNQAAQAIGCLSMIISLCNKSKHIQSSMDT